MSYLTESESCGSDVSVCCTDCKKADAVRFFRASDEITHPSFENGAYFAFCETCLKSEWIRKDIGDGLMEVPKDEFVVWDVTES